MKQNKGFQSVKNRIPYSTTSIDFQNILSILEKDEDFEKLIDKRISQLKKQGHNTSACSEYLENMADKYVAGLLRKLEKEHINNMHIIGYLFRKRASDRLEFEDFLERLDEEIASTESEYETIKKIADEMNPLKNGRLVAEQSISSDEEEEQDG
ncbi:MAG: hypothetical protein HDR23_10155 [Lachnospiraceae bacterium]|nr:hypothetical protein [Lachnospiraceae bacterium]